MSEKMVTISEDEYKTLKDESLLLSALQGCGVDNWEGYDDAMECYEQLKENEE